MEFQSLVILALPKALSRQSNVSSLDLPECCASSISIKLKLVHKSQTESLSRFQGYGADNIIDAHGLTVGMPIATKGSISRVATV